MVYSFFNLHPQDVTKIFSLQPVEFKIKKSKFQKLKLGSLGKNKLL